MDLLSAGVGFILGMLIYAIFTSTIKTTKENNDGQQEEPTLSPPKPTAITTQKRGRKPKTVEAKATNIKKTTTKKQ